MKKITLAFCIILGAVIAVNAQDSTSAASPSSQYSSQSMSQDQDDKQAIASSELPAAITQQLKGQDYSGWTVGQAYKKEKDGKTVYAVELKNGAETKMVKFDAQGNKLKEKDKGSQPQ